MLHTLEVLASLPTQAHLPLISPGPGLQCSLPSHSALKGSLEASMCGLVQHICEEGLQTLAMGM